MEPKIRTRHPGGKQGVNISKEKYDVIRAALIGCMEAGDELTHTELTRRVGEAVQGRFQGSISWYVEAVKLDLEARRVIERSAGSKPQRYRLVSQ